MKNKKTNKEKFINDEKIRNGKIIISALLFILVLIPILLNTKKSKNFEQKSEEKVKYEYNKKEFFHIEEDIIKDEKTKGIKFTNISLLTKNGQTTFTADVTNTTSKDIKTEDLDVNLLDKNNKVVITLRAHIPNGLKKNETKKVSASAKGEFKNVVSKVIK